jgi:hypothetical protein
MSIEVTPEDGGVTIVIEHADDRRALSVRDEPSMDLMDSAASAVLRAR